MTQRKLEEFGFPCKQARHRPRLKTHNANLDDLDCSELPHLLVNTTIEEMSEYEEGCDYEWHEWWGTLTRLRLTSKALHDAANDHILERAVDIYLCSLLRLADAHYWDGNPRSYPGPHYGVKWEEEWQDVESTVKWLRSLPKSTRGVPIGEDDSKREDCEDACGILEPLVTFWELEGWWPLDWIEEECEQVYATIESAIVSLDISALCKASQLMKKAERGARKTRREEWEREQYRRDQELTELEYLG